MSEKIKELRKWVGDICWDMTKDYVQIREEESKDTPEGRETTIRFRLFTDLYKYAIVAIDREKNAGYLGCVCVCNKQLPGETWTRGSDLADGKFKPETWDRIIRDIIRNELQKLSEYVRAGRPLPKEEEDKAFSDDYKGGAARGVKLDAASVI